jgi:hypothetical protein
MKNGVFWVLRRVSLVTPDVSEEPSASIIRVTRIDELGIMLVTANAVYWDLKTQFIPHRKLITSPLQCPAG